MTSLHIKDEASPPRHKTWAEINLSALRHNYRLLSDYIAAKSPDCRMICVVKADAYGHGADACVRTLYSCGARHFAVSCIDEALDVCSALSELRTDSFSLLILGYTLPQDVDKLIKYEITQTVYSYEYAKALSENLVRLAQKGKITKDERLKIHIKLDTGMNRLGFSASKKTKEKTLDKICKTASLPHIQAEGIFTHFACSDQPENPMTEEQFGSYEGFVHALADRGVRFEQHHVCNSAAALAFPSLHLDFVRVGLLLYGLMPTDLIKNPGVIPVMTFKTTVSHIHDLHKGDTVSYGAIFTAERNIRVATLSAGYADGYIRAFAKGGGVLIDGHFAPIVGRICMDQCVADVTGINVSVGDTAIIFDNQAINTERLAKVAETINYELVCLVGKRVPRIIIDKKDTF
ncbi:MAG: alanine racemase [Clostridiales bacterium]|nr:alanine racemase [Clostridiales bacterium]